MSNETKPLSAGNFRLGTASELGLGAAEVAEFLKQSWERDIALRWPKFYNWQFAESPDSEGRDRCILIVDSEKNIAGFMGVTRRKFFLGGESLEGAELTTWINSERIRGMGFGKAVLENLKSSYQVIMGAGISAMAVPVYLGAGFKYVSHLPRYVRVYHADAVAPVSEISELGLKLIQKSESLPQEPFNSQELGFGESEGCGKDFYGEFNCYSRDAGYLAWRYGSHPAYHYRMFRVDSGGSTASVIVRIDEKQSLRFVHVIDVWGDEKAFPGVVSFLDSFCKDSRADFSDFLCSSERLGRFFWSHGWFSVLNDEYVKVPHLFYPIEMRVPPTTSLILWSGTRMPDLLELGRLHLTKADLDLDRPTMQYVNEKKIVHA